MMEELLGDGLATGECLLIPVMSFTVSFLGTEREKRKFCYPVSVYLLSRDTTLSTFFSTINTDSKGCLMKVFCLDADSQLS